MGKYLIQLNREQITDRGRLAVYRDDAFAAIGPAIALITALFRRSVCFCRSLCAFLVRYAERGDGPMAPD